MNTLSPYVKRAPAPAAGPWGTPRVDSVTALQKSGAQKRVRGIVVGDTFRRLVAKTAAKQFAEEFAAACFPHQFGVVTPGGADCVTHLLRAEAEWLWLWLWYPS